MNYKLELQNNNADLNSILNTINSLPEGSSGGSGVETCTVIISSVEDSFSYFFTLYDGESYSIYRASTGETVENVMCGSMIIITGDDYMIDFGYYINGNSAYEVYDNYAILQVPMQCETATLRVVYENIGL